MENKTELNTNFNSNRTVSNCSSSFFKNDVIELERFIKNLYL